MAPLPSSAPACPPRLLSIAGSDSGGGAGIQADLKTFAALQAYGMTAITALTAQNTLGVQSIQAIPADMVTAQMDAVATDIGIDAAKTGMLGNPETVLAVAAALDRHAIRKLVVDPVMLATSGATLSSHVTAQAMVQHLFPRAALITPNLPEAAWLLGRDIHQAAQMEAAAHDLLALGCTAVLLKGGHLQGDRLQDLLLTAEGQLRTWTHPRIVTRNLHGTGCTLSAAIAVHLGRGATLTAAVDAGIGYVTQAITAGAHWSLGQGNGPLNHAGAGALFALP